MSFFFFSHNVGLMNVFFYFNEIYKKNLHLHISKSISDYSIVLFLIFLKK